MTYERDLAFNLRIRGISEREIAETLEEVRAHEAAAGTPAKDEFGAAQDYAKQFPKGRRRSRGAAVTTIAAAVSIAYVLAVVVTPFLGIDLRESVGPITLLPALAVILGGVLAGFLTDYLRPAPRSLQQT
ncbi:hypothetical protein [Arthrobacter globiformis]|uniref:hypothetical protein n=1 Tax=Arthrobacter globiformis TaxID=1665 RepID=UPI00278DDF90|nr:hypothetical protein [Arthrobacter globiformis]MDQ0620508.1 hypothetical protein [Arthrobacter globiformis]